MVHPSARVKVADSTAFDHPGIDPDSKLVQRQIKKFDEDGSGTLDLEEFEAFVSSILSADDDPAAASILAAFYPYP
eukprot:scaffold144409_cov78-Phaeocystis_antarctica.AAC.1